TVDYPDYSKKVVDGILENRAPLGILICGTGIERSRAHNDANIIVLGAKIPNEELACQMVDKFLTTKFEGGRHST
ncbi:putative sugar phosphate isomerase, partial [Pseudolycoriella hygida]